MPSHARYWSISVQEGHSKAKGSPGSLHISQMDCRRQKPRSNFKFAWNWAQLFGAGLLGVSSAAKSLFSFAFAHTDAWEVQSIAAKNWLMRAPIFRLMQVLRLVWRCVFAAGCRMAARFDLWTTDYWYHCTNGGWKRCVAVRSQCCKEVVPLSNLEWSSLIWIDLAQNYLAQSLHDIEDRGFIPPQWWNSSRIHALSLAEAAGCIRLRVHGTQAVDAGGEPGSRSSP